MRRTLSFVALAMLCGIVLAATVLRNDIAQAAGLAPKPDEVLVTNTPADPVPVQER
jgi:hypothetical protein